jgi:hypothetical protein
MGVGENTCVYVAKMIDGWATDTPTARHPWLVSGHVRLACAHRLGCLTEADYQRGRKILEDRFTALCQTTEPRRQPKRFEIAGKKHSAREYGITKAAAKTEEQASTELGGHSHADVDAAAIDFTATAPGETGSNGQAIEPTTWEPVDLGPYLRGEVAQPRPSMGIARSDGLRLIYPGREHAVLGETESGKTWLALGCVAAELIRGKHVVYIHYEEPDATSTIERLRLLGIPDSVIQAQLSFHAPMRPARKEWLAELIDLAPTLVVHDGVNEAMSLHGADIMAADGASAFRRQLILPFTRAGAATLACDHLPMVRDGSRRDAYGSVHKGNALDGARIVLENVEPFGRGLRGVSYVFATKDRPGFLRAHGRTSKTPGKTFMGVLVVDDSQTLKPFEMPFYAPKDDDEQPASLTVSPTELGDAMHEVIALLPDQTAWSSRKLYAAMRTAGHNFREAAYRSTVDDLIAAGRVVEVPGKRGATGYRAVVTTAAQGSDT